MTLCEVVSALVVSEKVSDKDIERTILYLTRDDVLQDARTLKRIVKALNAEVEYDKTV